jgi:hypothetical protein
MWGVSDPQRAGGGAKMGAAKLGVAHAPAVALVGCGSGADGETGGIERRRRQTRGR